MGGGGTGSTPLLNAASPPTDPPSLAAPTAPGARPGRASIRPRDGCLLWQRRQGGKERRRRSVIVSRDTLLRKQTDSGADGGSRKGHRPARRIRKAGRHRAKQAGVLSQARGGGGGGGTRRPHPSTHLGKPPPVLPSARASCAGPSYCCWGGCRCGPGAAWGEARWQHHRSEAGWILPRLPQMQRWR